MRRPAYEVSPGNTPRCASGYRGDTFAVNPVTYRLAGPAHEGGFVPLARSARVIWLVRNKTYQKIGQVYTNCGFKFKAGSADNIARRYLAQS
jgi:hypothetical protein